MQKAHNITSSKLDLDEQALLNAFEAGEMNVSSPSKANLERFKLAATETIIEERLLEKPSNLARNAG